MATGRLGIADLASATDTTLYTVPTDTFAVVTVSICNRTTNAVTIRMAIAASSTPAAGEFIEFDSTIPANAVLERTGLVMDAGKLLIVRASAASVSAVAWGIETQTV
jgi:hypothetical protein